MSSSRKLERRVVIGPLRICYPHVYTPWSMAEGEELKYSCCFLVPKDNKVLVDKIRQAISRAQIAGVTLWGGDIPEGLKMPLRDGDSERGDREEFINHFFFNGTSREKPGVVNGKRIEIFDPREVYAGCYCNVSLVFYPYKVGDSVGVGCELINMQKFSEGELITLRTTPEEDFQIIDEEDSSILS